MKKEIKVIEATETDFCRWLEWSRERVKEITDKITPTRTERSVCFYDVGEFVRTAKDAPETATQREKRLAADQAEETLRKVQSEFIDRDIVIEAGKRLFARVHRLIDSYDTPMTEEDRKELVAKLDEVIEGIPDEVARLPIVNFNP